MARGCRSLPDGGADPAGERASLLNLVGASKSGTPPPNGSTPHSLSRCRPAVTARAGRGIRSEGTPTPLGPSLPST
jgi:hypothetical protein